MRTLYTYQGDMTMAARPMLYVDVDGVLNPLGGHREGFTPVLYDGPGTEDLSADDLGYVRLNPAHGRFLREAHTMAEVVWATSWLADALRWLERWYELPEFPRLDLDKYANWSFAGWTTKGTMIRKHVDTRPMVWIDDQWGGKESGWAEYREAPTLLMQVDPREGLTEGQMQHILEWLKEHS